MVQRLAKLSQTQSFFLFGARGTGKSTLLKQQPFFKDSLYINLLQPTEQEKYSINPEMLLGEIKASQAKWVIIDEVQKVLKILDVVHEAIETSKVKFALTGSSSRKLKRGDANLLAGRAVVFSLYPFTSIELKENFDLNWTLSFGSLPKLTEFESSEFLDRKKETIRYLNSYLHTYIKEEILVEQLIRNLDPFRLFLPLAAQMEGEPLNYLKIAKQSGVQHKTIQSYYQILVETHLGFFLEPYGESVRKVQIKAPKFYFFDSGVKRAIEKKLTLPLSPKTTEYGNQFESWFIAECFRINSYLEADLSFSYLRTKDDAEIDLVIKNPDGKLTFVEIKSSNMILDSHLKYLKHFHKDFPNSNFICACQVDKPEKRDGVLILNWRDAINEIFKL